VKLPSFRLHDGKIASTKQSKSLIEEAMVIRDVLDVLVGMVTAARNFSKTEVFWKRPHNSRLREIDTNLQANVRSVTTLA